MESLGIEGIERDFMVIGGGGGESRGGFGFCVFCVLEIALVLGFWGERYRRGVCLF